MVTDESPAVPVAAQTEALHQTLAELEQSLHAATRAVAALRQIVGDGQPAPPVPLSIVRPAPAAPPQPVEPAAPTDQESGYSPFERLWERVERERLERQQQVIEEPERRGLDLLPRHYLMTVEDRERRVDLVPLHRALQSLPGIEEVTLVSFANGVPVVAVRTDRDLDTDRLRTAVAAAMDRHCEVIRQDNGRVFLRLTPHEEGGA